MGIGSTGAMWTLIQSVKMFRMVGHLRLVKVKQIAYVYNLVYFYKNVQMATPFTTIPVRQLTIF